MPVSVTSGQRRAVSSGVTDTGNFILSGSHVSGATLSGSQLEIMNGGSAGTTSIAFGSSTTMDYTGGPLSGSIQ